MIEMPAKYESTIRAILQTEELTPESFVGLVNSSLIFRTDSQLSDLAAQGLSRVRYQLRKVNGSDDPFPLLNGLALVSAVTRSTALAAEVRNLCRVARRRAARNLPLEVVARVALMAAAANNSLLPPGAMRRGGAQSAGCPKPTLVVRPTPGAGAPRFCGTIVRRFVTAFR